ncbi:hypothetical protein ECPA42_1971, partial [Escherichia coli PA42]
MAGHPTRNQPDARDHHQPAPKC